MENTISQLKKQAKQLYGQIYIMECFSISDLVRYEETLKKLSKLYIMEEQEKELLFIKK